MKLDFSIAAGWGLMSAYSCIALTAPAADERAMPMLDLLEQKGFWRQVMSRDGRRQKNPVHAISNGTPMAFQV
jgi:hypothetical protein